MKKLYPVCVKDTGIPVGEPFTIGWDYSDRNYEMVKDKTFIGVPDEYESSQKVRKEWDAIIRKMERL